jgi:hypothetical protein
MRELAIYACEEAETDEEGQHCIVVHVHSPCEKKKMMSNTRNAAVDSIAGGGRDSIIIGRGRCTGGGSRRADLYAGEAEFLLALSAPLLATASPPSSSDIIFILLFPLPKKNIIFKSIWKEDVDLLEFVLDEEPAVPPSRPWFRVHVDIHHDEGQDPLREDLLVLEHAEYLVFVTQVVLEVIVADRQFPTDFGDVYIPSHGKIPCGAGDTIMNPMTIMFVTIPLKYAARKSVRSVNN